MTVEHALIALKIGIMLLVDDVPQWMRESLARDKINADSERLSALVENGPGARNSDTFTQATPSVASQGTPFTPTRHTLTPSECDYGAPASTSTPASSVKYTARSQIAEQQAAEDKILASSKSGGKGATSSHKRSSALSNPSAQTENIAAAKLLKECGNQFGFDPLTMSALIAIPPILQNVGVNPFVYVPLAVLYFSYLQAKKDRADRKTAIGIVSDPALIKLVVHEMPRWVSDTEHQRVEWFNSVLQRMWPQLSQALEGNLMAAVQGVLDKQVVAVRMGLTMRRFTLGNTSPKILGIRVHDTQDSAVRLDVDIRWAGDPIVALGVGKGSFAPSVELAELRLSAMIRIELLDLMPALPCFRAMSVTCMQTPDVHFSLKVGSLDFMNMGPADFNMAALVRTVIDSALQDIAIYPKKMLFPLVADENVDAKAEGGEGTGSNNVAATAAGVLFLTFERAVNLKKVNLFSCNPYLVAKTDRDQTYRTKTVHGSRSPEWKETFELLVFDPTKQSVEVEVLDRGASMGRLSFGLSQLVPSRSVTATMKLTDGDAGELDLTYEYIPMRKSGGGLEEDASSDDDKDDDILFSLTKEDLDSDVLCHSERELESLREHKSTHRPHRSSAFLAHGMDGQPAQLSTLSRGSHFGPGKLVVSQRFAARYSVGILSISLIHVRNLKVDAYLMAAGRLYVELSVADKRLRTKSVTGSTFPHFPDSFSVVVKDLPQRQLLVEVKSKHSIGSDKVLGTVSVALADVVASGDVLEQEYILHGAQAECFVGLRLAVTASS